MLSLVIEIIIFSMLLIAIIVSQVDILKHQIPIAVGDIYLVFWQRCGVLGLGKLDELIRVIPDEGNKIENGYNQKHTGLILFR